MVEQNPTSDFDVFRAIADPTRRAMLEHLTERDCTIGELAEPHHMSFAAASKHIGILADAGLVTRRKQGRQRVCSLDPTGLIAVRDWVERYVGYWNARLDALESALKEDKDE